MGLALESMNTRVSIGNTIRSGLYLLTLASCKVTRRRAWQLDVLSFITLSHGKLFNFIYLLLICLAPSALAATKRVLVIHSFGNGTPPFTTHAVAFETELTEKMGERVDLDEVSLDMARYADADMQEALVEY